MRHDVIARAFERTLGDLEKTISLSSMTTIFGSDPTLPSLRRARALSGLPQLTTSPRLWSTIQLGSCRELVRTGLHGQSAPTTRVRKAAALALGRAFFQHRKTGNSVQGTATPRCCWRA